MDVQHGTSSFILLYLDVTSDKVSAASVIPSLNKKDWVNPSCSIPIYSSTSEVVAASTRGS